MNIKKSFYETIKSPNSHDSLGKRDGRWTILFDQNWNPTAEISKFSYYRILTYKNGSPQFPVTDFYINGSKQWEGNLAPDTLEDILVGKCQWFTADGKLKKESFYVNGVKTGYEKEFDLNGKIISNGQNLNGNFTGKKYTYYDNGAVSEIKTYKDGLLNGLFLEYWDDGKLLKKARYLNDKLHGEFNFFDEFGNLNMIEHYNHGVQIGTKIVFTEHKKISRVEHYKNGKLNGSYSSFYDNGRPEERGVYRNGNKIGIWYYFDRDGEYKKTEFMEVRVGAICNDGWESSATGSGACSHHGGVNYWLIDTEEVIIGGTGKHKSDFNYYY